MSQNQSVKERNSTFLRNFLLNGIVILLSLILFIQAVLFIREASSFQKVNAVDEAILIQMLTRQQYDSLVENVYRNEAKGVKAEGDMAQIYAAAYYYEAAMLYNAHQKAGNEQLAEGNYAQMLEYEKQLGEYAFVIEEIKAFLGMNPVNIK